jgi:hypothetical protein
VGPPGRAAGHGWGGPTSQAHAGLDFGMEQGGAHGSSVPAVRRGKEGADRAWAPTLTPARARRKMRQAEAVVRCAAAAVCTPCHPDPTPDRTEPAQARAPARVPWIVLPNYRYSRGARIRSLNKHSARACEALHLREQCRQICQQLPFLLNQMGRGHDATTSSQRAKPITIVQPNLCLHGTAALA